MNSALRAATNASTSRTTAAADAAAAAENADGAAADERVDIVKETGLGVRVRWRGVEGWTKHKYVQMV